MRRSLALLATLVMASSYAWSNARDRTTTAKVVEEPPPVVLTSFSFDDGKVDTGPDSLLVWETARGPVELTTSFHASGYQAVELRDAPGDSEFPELFGPFARQSSGRVQFNFAILLPDATGPVNIALAGPRFFAPVKGGFGVWLSIVDGQLRHHPHPGPRREEEVVDTRPLQWPKPVALTPFYEFTWYRVAVTYDVDRGRYDLTVHQEGHVEPVLELADQPNPSGEPGSEVDKFSFVTDPLRTDTVDTVYYVDDIVVASSRGDGDMRPFLAPGRRRLFVDYLGDYARIDRSQLKCLPVMDHAELGLTPALFAQLHTAGLAALVPRVAQVDPKLEDELKKAHADGLVSAEDRDTMLAVARWSAGCAALQGDDAQGALSRFRAALELQSHRQFRVAAAFALTRLGRFEEAMDELRQVQSAWRDDPRYAVAVAMIGAQRDDLDTAEDWLRLHVDALERADASSIAAVYDAHARLIADQHFYVMVTAGQFDRAEEFARRMASVLVDDDASIGEGVLVWGERERWHERAGDAKFYGGDSLAAGRIYEQLRQRAVERKSADAVRRLLVKLSDVRFHQGDVDGEKELREVVYGSLTSDPEGSTVTSPLLPTR